MAIRKLGTDTTMLHLRDEGGFTLIEALIAVAISVLVIAGFYEAYAGISSEVQASGRELRVYPAVEPVIHDLSNSTLRSLIQLCDDRDAWTSSSTSCSEMTVSAATSVERESVAIDGTTSPKFKPIFGKSLFLVERHARFTSSGLYCVDLVKCSKLMGGSLYEFQVAFYSVKPGSQALSSRTFVFRRGIRQ